MKNSALLLLLFVWMTNCCAQSKKSVEYQKVFAKTYGYVKYFNPSDESASIDWNKFAIFGTREVEKCTSDAELLETLKNIFTPIAPGIKFYERQEKPSFDIQKLTPKNLSGHKLTYWQHKGVSLGMNNNGKPYTSIRINRPFETDNSSPFGNIMTTIAAAEYQGKEFRYKGWVKLEKGSKGTGSLWFRVDTTDGTMGFFDNMGNSPITENKWQQYEIAGTIDPSASRLAFGCFLNGKGKLLLDDVSLEYKEGENWISIPLENNGFEGKKLTYDGQWHHAGDGYAFDMSESDKYSGNKSAIIQYVGNINKGMGRPLFEQHPKFGELIDKEIGQNISCQIPISLYCTHEHTYPVGNQKELIKLKTEIEKSSEQPTDLSMRLGNVINVYNVFQHFYPYFDVVDVDWEEELAKALTSSYSDRSEKDHLITLQKFTAPLKDGHIRVSSRNRETFAPPIAWEWIENKLVITTLYENIIDLAIGDEVLKIDGEDAVKFFEEVNSRISAGTDGWLKYRAQTESLFGPKDSKMVIETVNGSMELTRDEDIYRRSQKDTLKHAYRQLDKDVFYLNLDLLQMDTINTLLPALENSRSIICDLRGYPKGNHAFISYLLKSKDTTEGWMKVPQIIYPDQENIVGWEAYSWNLNTAKPYLGNKQIIFITDGSAISYAESFMGYIEGYALATIIGQPTAGTNGNINPFKLPGGYSLSWTGMKVNKHDGSQHHGIGITPDIYLSKTIEGIKAGKDEFLEKAIELTKR